MSYLVLARKWRPQTFDDLVGQEAIARVLKNAITHNKVAHAYIFSGPRGVGKTSAARILAKALNCEHGPIPEPCGHCPSCKAIADGSSMDVSEIDGASHTGVDNVRDLRERVRYAASGGRFKAYIIDEAHMLSTSAFNALLKTLEEPPPHVIFVLATTEPRKIPATVLSRCQHLPFRRIPRQQIKKRLALIAAAERLKATDTSLDMIAKAADGSMRDSLTILDQIASFSEDIGVSDIKDLLAITDVETLAFIATAVIEGNRKTILNMLSELTDSGADLKVFAKDLLQFFRNLLVTRIVGETADILDLSDEEYASLSGIKDKTSEEHLALILSELIKAEPGIRTAFYPRISLEMTLIRLALLSHFTSVDEALRMLRGPESGVQGDESVKKEPAGKTRLSKAPPSPSIEVTAAGSPDPTPVTASGREAPGEINTSSLRDIWNATLERLEATNHPLACKLREGEFSFGTDEIKVVYNGGLSVHAESVKESLPLVKSVILEIAGRQIPVKLETKKARTVTKKDLREKALSDPTVKEALALFEGSIVDVIPIPDKKQ